MPKHHFNDFLNLSAGPSTPRGRGRGGGMRGGRGGGRGGTPVSKRSYNADYTNVGFDYNAINTQGYRRMEGFSVDPFGAPAGSTPDNTSFRGRGRGRGRGAFASHGKKHGGLGHDAQRVKDGEGSGAPHTPSSAPSAPDTPSGARTPVTGLGIPRPAAGSLISGAIGTARGKAPIRAMQPRQTRDGQVLWGGRGAPLFVKAGELFKDGEVDTVHPEALTQPLAADVDEPAPASTQTLPPALQASPIEPSAAVLLAEEETSLTTEIRMEEQTLLLSSDTASLVERTSEISLDGQAAQPGQEARSYTPPAFVPEAIEPSVPPHLDMDIVVAVPVIQPEMSSGAPPTLADEPSVDPTILAAPAEEDDVQTASNALEATAASTEQAPESQVMAEEDLFFIDTEPSGIETGPASIQYDTLTKAPLGTTQSDSEEEQIVFKPRTFGQPKPLDIRLPSQASTSATCPLATAAPDLSLASGKPGRKAKKALKKEKRKMRGTGKKATRRTGLDAMEGSDIEWGSDGLPAGVFDQDVDIDDMVEDDDEDMAILKDYLAGTKLGAESDDDSINGDGDGIGESGGSADVDEALIGAPGLGSKAGEALKKGRRKMRQKGWDDAPDLILDAALDMDTDEDSSELGDLQAIMAALDSDEEELSESEMGEEERLFTGKHAWTSEDEDTWFVRSMEEALSGKKPSNGKTTHIGLFGSMQNGYDDLDLPTVPKLKGKKKIEGVPEELQAQWEADRRKKAVKKEQRQIERLLADLAVAAPSSSTSKRKAKGSAKGSAKAKQASLAHLIPASAAEVADMFDVSSDDAAMSALASGMGLGRSGGRKGKGKAMMQYAELAMGGFDSPRGGGGNSINTGGGGGIGGLIEQIRVFVDDPHQTTHTLPPMDKEGRRKMHMLAECFDLKSKSRGQGKARFTILIKTSRTGLAIDEDSISRLLSASQYTGGYFYKAYFSNGKPNKFAQGGSGGGGAKSGKKGGPPGDRGNSTRARDGELVGGGADRIGQDNVGHKLLSMMGWAEGGRIGRTEGGLEQPIIAVVKNTKSGLGA